MKEPSMSIGELIKEYWEIIAGIVAAGWAIWLYNKGKGGNKAATYTQLSTELAIIRAKIENIELVNSLDPLNKNLEEISAVTGALDALNKTTTVTEVKQLSKTMTELINAKNSAKDQQSADVGLLAKRLNELGSKLEDEQASSSRYTEALIILLAQKQVLWDEYRNSMVSFFEDIAKHFNSLPAISGYDLFASSKTKELVTEIMQRLKKIKIELAENKQNLDFINRLEEMGLLQSIVEIDKYIISAISTMQKEL